MEKVCNSLPYCIQLLSFLLLICESFVPWGNQQIFYPFCLYFSMFLVLFIIHQFSVVMLTYLHIFFYIHGFVLILRKHPLFNLKIIKDVPVFFQHFYSFFFFTFDYFLHLEFISVQGFEQQSNYIISKGPSWLS